MATYNNLDWLRSKHNRFDRSAGFATLHGNLVTLDNGIEEANPILKFSDCFSKLEAENQLLKFRIQKLEENSIWLSEELRSAQNKLHISERTVISLRSFHEVENF